jgi:hypothetical protein
VPQRRDAQLQSWAFALWAANKDVDDWNPIGINGRNRNDWNGIRSGTVQIKFRVESN